MTQLQTLNIEQAMKTSKYNLRTFPVTMLTCVAGLALLMGCASSNFKKGASTSSSLQASADKITEGSARVDAALTSLSELMENPNDLPAQFKEFSSAVNSLQTFSKDVSSKFAGMSKKGEAYFAEWDQQLAQIQNEDIRTRSAERKSAVQKQFDAIKNSYEEASGDFKPFMADLKDIQTALATDLTPGGLSAIKKSADKAVKSGNEVKDALGKLAAQFKELGVAMAASVPQPATE